MQSQDGLLCNHMSISVQALMSLSVSTEPSDQEDKEAGYLAPGLGSFNKQHMASVTGHCHNHVVPGCVLLESAVNVNNDNNDTSNNTLILCMQQISCCSAPVAPHNSGCNTQCTHVTCDPRYSLVNKT